MLNITRGIILFLYFVYVRFPFLTINVCKWLEHIIKLINFFCA